MRIHPLGQGRESAYIAEQHAHFPLLSTKSHISSHQLGGDIPIRDHVQQVVILLLQRKIAGHLIEGTCQLPDFIMRGRRNLHVEVPFSDRLRARHQLVNRHGETVRQQQTEEQRDDDRQGADHQDLRAKFAFRINRSFHGIQPHLVGMRQHGLGIQGGVKHALCNYSLVNIHRVPNRERIQCKRKHK